MLATMEGLGNYSEEYSEEEGKEGARGKESIWRPLASL